MVEFNQPLRQLFLSVVCQCAPREIALGEQAGAFFPAAHIPDHTQSKTPHSIVQRRFAEIETIYRAYQVLLLNPLRT